MDDRYKPPKCWPVETWPPNVALRRKLDALLRRKLATRFRPEHVDRAMIEVLTVTFEDAMDREQRLRAVIRFLIAELLIERNRLPGERVPDDAAPVRH
jgi:hypothetical protein